MDRTTQIMNQIEDALEVFFHPTSWPAWLRKLAVLLFPISLPLWLCGAAIIGVFLIFMSVLTYIAVSVIGVWTGERW